MKGFHKHKCYRCGYVWGHDRKNIPDGGFTEAHTCAKCGKEETWCYSGKQMASMRSIVKDFVMGVLIKIRVVKGDKDDD